MKINGNHRVFTDASSVRKQTPAFFFPAARLVLLLDRVRYATTLHPVSVFTLTSVAMFYCVNTAFVDCFENRHSKASNTTLATLHIRTVLAVNVKFSETRRTGWGVASHPVRRKTLVSRLQSINDHKL